ncbi:MAG: penicillin-binding protein 2 [Pseudomonadota bacterium]
MHISRITLIGWVFIVFFAALSIRVVVVVTGEGLAARVYESAQVRSDIVDRNGVPMAVSLERLSLQVRTDLIRDAQAMVDSLSIIFKPDEPGHFYKLIEGRKGTVVLRRRLTPRQAQEITMLGNPALELRPEQQRHYPQKQVPSHVIGVTDIDGRGVAGIEKGLDERLRSKPDPVHLTIDVRVQAAIRRVLHHTIAKFDAKGGVAIVQDVKNGEIIAMVSLPDFDPSKPDPRAPGWYAKATTGAYEMGSVMKVFNVATAIDSGIFRHDSIIDATGTLKIGRQTIRDYHPQKRPLTLREVLMHSSNIASGKIALALGEDVMMQYFSRYHFDKALPIEVPERRRPSLPRQWRRINLATASFGHGFAVTPLHVISAFSAVVNGGVYYAPHLVKTTDARGQRILSSKTSAQMRAWLRSVVHDEGGTGAKADVKGYEVGGKTGTAEMVHEGAYDTDRLLSSFISAFPMHDPRYAVLVMIEEPKGLEETYGYATGGWTAAPAAGEMISRIGPMLSLLPDTDIAVAN